MKNKTRVALCLSGEPRSSMFCFPYIYESLIDIGDEYEVDVYIHSWKYFRALPLYKCKEYLLDWIDEESFFRNILYDLTDNKNYTSETINQELNFLSSNTFNAGALKNTFLMYTSMQKCFNLIKEPYDVYIRGRFDFYIPFKMDISSFIKDVKDKTYDIILPSKKHYTKQGEILHYSAHDHFAICNLKGAEYYFNIFDYIFDIVPHSKFLSPHAFLSTYLEKSNLNLKTFSTSPPLLDLVRSSRIITSHKLPYLDN